MKDIHIRQATRDDLNTLLEFEQGIIRAERPFDETLKEGRISYYSLKAFIDDPDTKVLVAEQEGELIGSGYARITEAKPYLKYEKFAHLGFMYVHPGHRGKGVNRLIMEDLKQWCLSRNITEMRLNVYCDNHAAIKAYEKTGFSGLMINMRMALDSSGEER